MSLPPPRRASTPRPPRACADRRRARPQVGLVAALVSVASILSGCTSLAPPTLCVVRHAEAFKNLDPVPEGLTPEQRDALTPAGQAQARRIAAELPAGVARVWASPTGRTRQTAELLGLSPAVVIEPALRPIDGDVAWEVRLAAWARGEDPRPEGGESLRDAWGRVAPALARLRDGLRPGQVGVAVTHGDIASLLLGELRGSPLLDRPSRDTLATGAVTCLPLRSGAGS